MSKVKVVVDSQAAPPEKEVRLYLENYGTGVAVKDRVTGLYILQISADGITRYTSIDKTGLTQDFSAKIKVLDFLD